MFSAYSVVTAVTLILTVELAAFTLVNLTGEYRLSKEWLLRARIDNLLDEQYSLANGYTAAGASAYLTLSYRQ